MVQLVLRMDRSQGREPLLRDGAEDLEAFLNAFNAHIRLSLPLHQLLQSFSMSRLSGGDVCFSATPSCISYTVQHLLSLGFSNVSIARGTEGLLWVLCGGRDKEHR
eukprot:3966171-Amphidinium_carterae.1